MTPRRPLKWHPVTDAPLRQRLQAPVTLDVHGWAVLLAQNGVVIALHYRRTRMSWTTPTLVEICIGLEINGYLPAEF